MPVLPTTYLGVQYRSRTEARWAVVFDELGWRYHYEVEGFGLPSGLYLPDFYLPVLDTYFEVKGCEPSIKEKVKAAELCVETGSNVIVSTGPPNPRREEYDDDLITFVPESVDGQELFAFEYLGGFVSRRWPHHPACSIHLGNLGYLGSNTDINWRTAFGRAASHRFGVYG